MVSRPAVVLGVLLAGLLILVMILVHREGGPSNPRARNVHSTFKRDPLRSGSLPRRDPGDRSHGGTDRGDVETEEEAQPRDLSDLDAAFRRRVSAIEAEIIRRLFPGDGPSGLAYLQDLLALPAPTDGNRLEDDRIRRFLAAKYLPWVADKDPALIPAVLSLSKTLLRDERDRYVRYQLIANFAGLHYEPKVSMGSSDGGPMNVIEGFSRSRFDSKRDPWKNSLRRASAEDSELVSLLATVAADKSDAARIVTLVVLVRFDTRATLRIVLDLFDQDPSSRRWCARELAKTPKPETLRSFVRAIPSEPDPSVLQTMAQTVAATVPPPAGAGEAIRRAFEIYTCPPYTNPEFGEQAKGALAGAAVRILASSQDPAAMVCVTEALRSPSEEIRYAVYRAAARHPHPSLLAPLKEAQSRTSSEYDREFIGWAIRKVDPTDQTPNLFWDIEGIKAQLKRSGLTEAERQELERRLAEKKAALDRMSR